MPGDANLNYSGLLDDNWMPFRIFPKAGMKKDAYMPLSHRFFPAFWIGLLLFAGLAQAQSSPGGSSSQSIKIKADDSYLQPWQPCLNPDQEGIKGSLQEERRQSSQTIIMPLINKPNYKDKNKKAVGAENTVPKSNSLGPSFGKNRGSKTLNISPHVGSGGNLSIYSGSLGSSFLNGYLLNSLQDKELKRKKETKKKGSKDDMPPRVKRAL